MSSILIHIQTAFRKIERASILGKGCYLSVKEVNAISIHHSIPDAIGDYDSWIFTPDGDLIES